METDYGKIERERYTERGRVREVDKKDEKVIGAREPLKFMPLEYSLDIAWM